MLRPSLAIRVPIRNPHERKHPHQIPVGKSRIVDDPAPTSADENAQTEYIIDTYFSEEHAFELGKNTFGMRIPRAALERDSWGLAYRVHSTESTMRRASQGSVERLVVNPMRCSKAARNPFHTETITVTSLDGQSSTDIAVDLTFMPHSPVDRSDFPVARRRYQAMGSDYSSLTLQFGSLKAMRARPYDTPRSITLFDAFGSRHAETGRKVVIADRVEGGFVAENIASLGRATMTLSFEGKDGIEQFTTRGTVPVGVELHLRPGGGQGAETAQLVLYRFVKAAPQCHGDHNRAGCVIPGYNWWTAGKSSICPVCGTPIMEVFGSVRIERAPRC
ncbi:uncharacterized protein MKK02DRAFT_45126 [Dioszegia hungarica]|uniref:Uncharacterized protein n=1 Tax=Dioszegia hungarica TaxID=4972 RepID=A0AA38LWA3_9TREE|nr:uncharacterized protein MKK02DRAFT_45126 [Dioszegia hungarica]KAI9636419.1 hypothetical protein MKK02DRAFT_45126 [Dioszegia hungarica]